MSDSSASISFFLFLQQRKPVARCCCRHHRRDTVFVFVVLMKNRGGGRRIHARWVPVLCAPFFLLGLLFSNRSPADPFPSCSFRFVSFRFVFWMGRFHGDTRFPCQKFPPWIVFFEVDVDLEGLLQLICGFFFLLLGLS